MNKYLLPCLILLALAHPAPAQEPERADVAVTAYNVDRAVIKDTRVFSMKPGINWIDFSDVAAQIDPTSVHLTSANIEIKEQNFDYDVVSDAKLLNKYLNEQVIIADKDGDVHAGQLIVGGQAHVDHEGKITYAFGNLAVRNPTGLLTILPKYNIADVRFPSLPQGLITKPTLRWKILSANQGRQPCEIAYMTKGMSWHADYDLIIKSGTNILDLTGLVTINNQTGATYENASLKLVAGEVNVVEDETGMGGAGDLMDRSSVVAEKAALPQFKEKSFFEYHLYTLQRRTTLKDNQTKQIDFVEAQGIKAERIYVYDGVALVRYYGTDHQTYGTECNKKVDVYLEFKNSKENNMGMPLPGGKIRLKSQDETGQVSYIGEDEIEHTPKDEEILLKVGCAFDLVGERKQTDFKKIDRHTIEEAFEITLRNHKKETVEIRVVEHLYRWADWSIIAKSHDFLKTDSKTIEFRIKVEPEEQARISYRVRYKR